MASRNGREFITFKEAKVGRPSKYVDEFLPAAQNYLIEYKTIHNQAVPSVAGFARTLGLPKLRVYDWATLKNVEGGLVHPEFSYAIAQIANNQEDDLINGGLKGDFNPGIVKLLLGEHGYADKTIVDSKQVVQNITNEVSADIESRIATLEDQDIIDVEAINVSNIDKTASKALEASKDINPVKGSGNEKLHKLQVNPTTIETTLSGDLFDAMQ